MLCSAKLYYLYKWLLSNNMAAFCTWQPLSCQRPNTHYFDEPSYPFRCICILCALVLMMWMIILSVATLVYSVNWQWLSRLTCEWHQFCEIFSKWWLILCSVLMCTLLLFLFTESDNSWKAQGHCERFSVNKSCLLPWVPSTHRPYFF